MTDNIYLLSHGYCNIAAACICDILEKHNISFYSEKAYARKHHRKYMHEYVVITNNNKNLYADIRGIYDDKNNFLQEFIDWHNDHYNDEITYNDIIFRQKPNSKVKKKSFADIKPIILSAYSILKNPNSDLSKLISDIDQQKR